MSGGEPPRKKHRMETINQDIDTEESNEILLEQEDPTEDETEESWNGSQETVEHIGELSIVQAEAEMVEATEERMDVSQDMFDGCLDTAPVTSEGESSAGVNLENLPRVGISVPPQYPAPRPSSTVCVDLNSLDGTTVPDPYPPRIQDIWDGRYVKLPWSSSSVYPVNVDNKKEFLPRWDLIKTALSQPFSTWEQVTEAILSYNSRFCSDDYDWSFQAMGGVVEEFTEEEQDNFFTTVLPGMVRLCLDGPKAVTKPMHLLKSGQTSSITLSQYQISVLLANAFFCTFPRRNSSGANSEYSNYPCINFNRLLSVSSRRPEAQAEKIKCILAYFSRVSESPSTGLLTFMRQSVPRSQLPYWSRELRQLTGVKLRLSSCGTIEEDGGGMLQVDFANRFIGGGVLGEGLVQEEIRFTICPELIVSRLFTEALEDEEVVIIHGAEQFTRYSGYGDSFKFCGRFEDTTEYDHSFRRNTTIVAMDATCFRDPEAQFTRRFLTRELNKAYVGFYQDTLVQKNAVATGNWGCGAFRGNPQLKFLLQLMAAALTGRDLLYLTFGDQDLVRDGWAVYELLVERSITVGHLYRILARYRDS